MNIYTTYALIENGVAVEYPVNPRVTIASTGDFNVPWNWGGGELDGKTYAYIHDNKPPTTHEEITVETTPYFDAESGFWYRGYEVQPASIELIAERYRVADTTSRQAIADITAQYSDTKAQELGLTEEQRADWARFRAEMQTVPQQVGYPFQYSWPVFPESQENRMKLKVVRV
jgi:hypothetical protein